METIEESFRGLRIRNSFAALPRLCFARQARTFSCVPEPNESAMRLIFANIASRLKCVRALQLAGLHQLHGLTGMKTFRKHVSFPIQAADSAVSAQYEELATVGVEPVSAARFHLGYRRWLDGLRGLAILLVMAYHLRVFLVGGWLGVDLFFLSCSGFLITSALIE